MIISAIFNSSDLKAFLVIVTFPIVWFGHQASLVLCLEGALESSGVNYIIILPAVFQHKLQFTNEATESPKGQMTYSVFMECFSPVSFTLEAHIIMYESFTEAWNSETK